MLKEQLPIRPIEECIYPEKFDLYAQLSRKDFIEKGVIVGCGKFAPRLYIQLYLRPKPRWLPVFMWRWLLSSIFVILYC